MRSTRQKLKLLRGISRASANGGSGLTSRKSSNGNHCSGNNHSHHHHLANGNSGVTSNGNGSINGEQASNYSHHQQSHKQHHHPSTALSQHNNQFYNNSVSPTTHHPHSTTNSVGSGRHQRFQAKSQAATTVARSGAVRAHTTSSLSSPTSPASAESSPTSSSSRSHSTSEVEPFVIGIEDSVIDNNNSVGKGHVVDDTGGTHINPLVSGNNIGLGHPHRQWTQFLTTNMDCTGLNSDIREKAFGICRDYLHGAWKQIDSKDLVIKRVSGGLSNWLYHCSLPLSLTPQHNEPAQVLLRFYGQVHGEGALESLITESVIFTLLSERKLGPRLYGVFPGGRVEEFIPARPLQTVELRDPELSLLIAQKTAQIHGLNIPISKEPSWLWGTMDRWMANVRECFMKFPAVADCKEEILRKLIDYNLEAEFEWLKEFLPKTNSPVVFAHNDLQEGNILIRPEYETPDDKLALIDFEYCSYNYRGFDLANHFCEWSYNYNVEHYPNFKFTPGDLPSLEEKLRYIRRYVTVLREEYRMNFADADDNFLQTNPLFDEDHIVKEVEAFTLASHFFWSLWAIVNAQVSRIPFGYWEYGLCRLETYFNLKKTLV